MDVDKMKACEQCGAEMPDVANYCGQCGRQLNGPQPDKEPTGINKSDGQVTVPQPSDTPKPTGNRVSWALILASLVILLLLIIFSLMA